MPRTDQPLEHAPCPRWCSSSHAETADEPAALAAHHWHDLAVVPALDLDELDELGLQALRSTVRVALGRYDTAGQLGRVQVHVQQTGEGNLSPDAAEALAYVLLRAAATARATPGRNVATEPARGGTSTQRAPEPVREGTAA